MNALAMAASPRFGPAGRGESFANLGFKKMEEVPDYLAGFALTAFEYQSGHGVRVNEGTLQTLAQKGKAAGIAYSIHAPYYISMASPDEEKRQNSVNYLLQSAAALRLLGGERIIFHCGGFGGQSAAEALAKVADTLARARAALDGAGYEDLYLCPEVMGKYAQIGNVQEILGLCRADKRHIPCVDFGHLNSLLQGALRTKQDFAAVADAIGEALGDKRARVFHVHFSKIEYTKAGEKRHLTFADEAFGPPFEPFLDMVYEKGLAPVVICESAGSQTEDAQSMMQYYKSLNR